MKKEVKRGRTVGTYRSLVWRVERHKRDELVENRREGQVWPVVATWMDSAEGGTSRIALEQVPTDCQEAVHRQQCELMGAVEMDAVEWRREWTGGGFVVGQPPSGAEWVGNHAVVAERWGEGDMGALLGEGWWGVKSSTDYERALERAGVTGVWEGLDVYSDGGADLAGTEEASADYGWVIGGTDRDALAVWGEGGAKVRGVPRDMTSNRAEMYGLIAVLVKTRHWRGVVRAWLDNDNVRKGVQKLQGKILPEELWEAADRSWEERVRPAGIWFQEVQDRDLWEVLALLVAGRGDKLEVEWVRSHSDGRGAWASLNKHQRGNVRADAICNRLKDSTASRTRLQLPRLRSWRVCWEGVEVVGTVKGELKKKLDAAKIVRYFAETRGWGEAAEAWLGKEFVGDWFMRGKRTRDKVDGIRSMFSMWDTSDVRAKRAKCTEEERSELAKCELCGEDARGVQNGTGVKPADC